MDRLKVGGGTGEVLKPGFASDPALHSFYDLELLSHTPGTSVSSSVQ